jgi:fatty-acyl-CoA synthase
LLRWLICIGADAPGFVRFDKVAARAEPSHRCRTQRPRGDAEEHGCHQRSVHLGTTGSPKGATLSHRNILNNAYFVGQRMGAGEGDRFCIQVPLYHCGSMVVGTLLCIVHGATMVFPSEWFDPLASLEAIAAERCGIVGGVPTMFLAMLNHPKFSRFDLTSLRTGWVGGVMPGRNDGAPRGDASTRPQSFSA